MRSYRPAEIIEKERTLNKEKTRKRKHKKNAKHTFNITNTAPRNTETVTKKST